MKNNTQAKSREDILKKLRGQAAEDKIEAELNKIRIGLGVVNPEHYVDTIKGIEVPDELDLENYLEGLRSIDFETDKLVTKIASTMAKHWGLVDDIQTINKVKIIALETYRVSVKASTKHGLGPLSILGNSFATEIDTMRDEWGIDYALKVELHTVRDNINAELERNGHKPLTELEDAVLSASYNNPDAAVNGLLAHEIKQTIDKFISEGKGVDKAIELSIDVYLEKFYNNPENNEAFINSGYLPDIASTGDIYEQLGMTQEEYAAYYEARYQEFIEKEVMPYDSDGDGVLNEAEKQAKEAYLAEQEGQEGSSGVNNIEQVPAVWGIDQTMALIAAVGSLDAFIDALENGDELAAIAYILDTISSLDDASTGLINGGILQSEQISNWIDNAGEAFLSAYHLYEAISNGESVDAIVAGIDFVDDIYDGITDVIAGENTQGITINGVDIGGYLSVFATVNALSDGNIGGAISQGYSAYTQLSGIEGSGNIAGAIAVATSVMNGDEFGAALAMTNFIPGYGPVIYAGLSVLRATGVLQPVEDLYGDYSEFLNDNDWAALVLPGGQAIYAISKLSKMFADDPPDPEAQMEFIRDTNGNISFSTSSNVTGAGLEKVLQEQGSAWSEYMQSLDEAYSPYLPDGQINVDNLPQLGIMQDYQNPDVGLEWSLQGGNNLGNAKQILGVGDEVTGEDIARGLRDTMLITHLNDSWVVGESTYVDPVTGKEIKQTHYSPLGYVSIGSPNVVNVVGTGIFVGGGNVEARQETQYAKYDEIKALTNKKTPTPVKELSNVTNTHLIPKDLFHGENGKLLAVALGAGAVSLSDYAASQDYLDYFTPDEVSVFDDAIYGALLEESSNIIIGGVSYNAAGKYAKEEIAPSGDYSIDYSDSLFERHDVYRDVITSVMNDEIYVKAA